MKPLLLLVAVTAVWGVTFVQVKDAVAIYPLFAFLALRFAIASCTLAAPAATRVRSLGRQGIGAAAFAGALLGAGYALQTAGLQRTSVSSTGFITGMYVVLTPLLALVCFRTRIGATTWCGVLLATAGLALLAGVHGGSPLGDLLVLAGAAVYSLQIVLMERYAPRYDALAFTLVEMLTAFAGLLVVALLAGQLDRPARLDGLERAARDRRLRERARLPRADVGAASCDRHADSAGLLAGACVGRLLRLHPRRRPARCDGLARLSS